MNHYPYGYGDSGSLPSSYPSHVYHPEDEEHAQGLMTQSGPWPMPDYTRSSMPSMSQGSMGPYLPPSFQHGTSGQNFDFNLISSPSVFPQNLGIGIYTPDHSPPTATVPLSENCAFTSEPPKAESPSMHEQLEQINMALMPSSPVQRRDGVRKKNAKFEIPEGRTIEKINALLETATEEGVIRSLKSQKRLLKNRFAALQSRQRKKEYTELLEAENRGLKDSLMKARRENAATPLPIELNDSYANCIGKLRQELDMAQRQNQQLHLENSSFCEQLQSTFANPAPAILPSTDYTLGTSDADGMTFGSKDFDFLDDSIFLNSEVEEVKKESRGETSISIGPSLHSISPNTLLTLLMYGAHVASITSQEDVGTMKIPSLSAEDCSASTTLLRVVYNSTGPSMLPRQNQNSANLDLGNLTADNDRAISEFRLRCDDTPIQIALR